MSYEDTNCPCGGKKLTDTMLCDECVAHFSDRREMSEYRNTTLANDYRRSAAAERGDHSLQLGATAPAGAISTGREGRMKRGDRHIVGIDLETGGFEPGRHSILAIGAYWQDFCGREHKLRLLCERVPSTVVEPEAAKKNGWVSDEQWLGLGAVSLPAALALTEEWLVALAMELAAEKLEPLAHNHASLDRPFLEYWTREFGLLHDFEGVLSHAWHDSMCALRAAQVAGLVPAAGGATLDAMIKHMGRVRRGGIVGSAGASPHHDAGEDARLCFDGYHWLTSLMARGRTVEGLAHAAALRETRSEAGGTPALPDGIYNEDPRF